MSDEPKKSRIQGNFIIILHREDISSSEDIQGIKILEELSFTIKNQKIYIIKRKVHISLYGYSYFCHNENSVQNFKIKFNP